MKTNQVELLAPAGNMAALHAAVAGGADAVYLGFETFNARRGADNFTLETLREACDFAHLRGVSVYVTMNTIILPDEVGEALECVRQAYRAGADGFIVQDIGLAAEISRTLPEASLHLSTQMNTHNLAGVRAAARLGAERITLAREVSLAEIALLCAAAAEEGMEVEVFAHGALCVCYSGQCFMSSMIGGRSANRGMCAQACRLPYELQNKALQKSLPSPGDHLLSPQDLCTVDRVDDLVAAGVASLKIEGRMKRPEYAAIVTKVYSDLLREHRRPTAEERDILRRVFSRDGFTDGYYTGKLGDSMFGTKTDVPMNEVKKLYDEAAHRFAEGKEAPLVPVSLCFTARKDTGAVLSADGVSVVMPVEQAQNRPTTPEMIEKSLRKTGGTPFYIENMRIEVQDGLMIPASVMNGMRRDALDLLLAKRGVAPSRDWLHGSVLPRDDETAAREGFRGYTATVRTKAQADALRELGLETVYVPLEVAAQTGLPAILPRVFSDNEQPQIEMLLGEAMSRGTDTVLAGNIGHIPLAKRLGFTVHGDFGLNAYNSKTLSALAEMGVSRQTLSFEARLAQIRDMRGPLETDLIVYGRLPLMIFENCAIRRQHGGKCSCQNGVTYLTDRRRERFPLLNEFGCRNTLLNSRPLCLREDFARLGVQTARLQFTIESPEECVRIARAFLSGAPLDGEFTNGLYKRGVE